MGPKTGFLTTRLIYILVGTTYAESQWAFFVFMKLDYFDVCFVFAI